MAIFQLSFHVHILSNLLMLATPTGLLACKRKLLLDTSHTWSGSWTHECGKLPSYKKFVPSMLYTGTTPLILTVPWWQPLKILPLVLTYSIYTNCLAHFQQFTTG